MTNHQQFLQWIGEGKLDRIRFCAEGNSVIHSFLVEDMDSYRFVAAVRNDDPESFDWRYMNVSLDAELINVNGFSVPLPLRNAPKMKAAVFLAVPTAMTMFSPYVWKDSSEDNLWLTRGLLHDSSEAAIAHAKAMLGIAP